MCLFLLVILLLSVSGAYLCVKCYCYAQVVCRFSWSADCSTSIKTNRFNSKMLLFCCWCHQALEELQAKSVICNKVSISEVPCFALICGICKWHCSSMGRGLVNLFNMENISWDCYRFLTALLPLCHIWQQTIPCCLCSPCPFLPFFRHHSFHFPFISPIVHHHLPSNPTPLSLLINGQFKMTVLLLSPHL